MNEGAGVPSEQHVLETIVEIARLHLEEAYRFDGPLEELPARRLVVDLGLDSVQLLTLAMEMENHFQITLDDVDPLAEDGDGDPAQTVETVADLVTAVRDALARQGRGED